MIGLIYSLLLTAYGRIVMYPEVKGGTWNDAQVNYLLWTRSNSGDNEPFSLQITHQSIEDSNFNTEDKTYFLYHGYGSEGDDYWILDFKDEILAIEAANIISVDYGHLATIPNYLQSVNNSYEVAKETAIFIDWMSQEIGLDYSKIHLIGYSLGAHVAGMTGAYVTGNKVDRITGLDPAGPYFSEVSADRRIDKSHAVFVDIIHTNSGSLQENCYGLFDAVGHVDFYPNGGKHQPGCRAETDLIIDCSHARAPAVLLESIRNSTGSTAFNSWPCLDWKTFDSGQCNDCGTGCQNMGMNADRNLEGSFYLRTYNESLFSIGDEQ